MCAAARAVQEQHHIKDSVTSIAGRKVVASRTTIEALHCLYLCCDSYLAMILFNTVFIKNACFYFKTPRHIRLSSGGRAYMTQIKLKPRTGNSAVAAHKWWYTKNESTVVDQENFLLVMQNVIFKTHLFV